MTANLSITINPPPPRGAALYDNFGTGWQIGSNGSLTLLSSSPEPKGIIVASPTLPLIFGIAVGSQTETLESLLVNSNYSLSVYSSSMTLPSFDEYALAVDPSGSNLYANGVINSNQASGVLIYSADGMFTSVGSVAISNLNILAPLVFTPDGNFAFALSLGSPGSPGSILTFSRAANGTLTQVGTFALPGTRNPATVAVSPDGMYLAEGDGGAGENSGVVQVFSIASDGTLTAATQPLTLYQNQQDEPVYPTALTWDSSSAYLLAATALVGDLTQYGGVAVVNFSGNSLTETAYPTGGFPVGLVLRDGTFVYAAGQCRGEGCPDILGFDFQNGQLATIPGSPWLDNQAANISDIVIY